MNPRWWRLEADGAMLDRNGLLALAELCQRLVAEAKVVTP